MIQRILPPHTRIVRHGPPPSRCGVAGTDRSLWEPLIGGLTSATMPNTLAVLGRRPGQAISFYVSSSSYFPIGEHPTYVGKRVTNWLFTAHCQLSE